MLLLPRRQGARRVFGCHPGPGARRGVGERSGRRRRRTKAHSKPSDAENAENDAEAPPDDQCDERDDAVDPRIKMIPYVVFCTDLVVALGSGCTIKFFPLWFKNDLRMSPAAVQGIYCGVPLSMALASGFCTALSRRIGRVEAVLGVRTAALICFAGMLAVFYRVRERGAFEASWRCISYGPRS